MEEYYLVPTRFLREVKTINIIIIRGSDNA